jgi:phosphohistidine phosphatase
MHLLLMRHGEAAAPGSDGTDESRLLTPLGRRQTRRAGELASRLRLRPTRALTSPLARTRATAEEFLSAFDSPPGLEPLPALAPGGDPETALEELAGAGEAEVLLMVGHNPGVGRMAGLLGLPLVFTPATLAVFSLARRGGNVSLELFLRPDRAEALLRGGV